MTASDATYKRWCKRELVSQLQPRQEPLRPDRQALSSAPGPSHRLNTAPTRRLDTDHISEWTPPSDTRPWRRDPQKFDALSRSAGWSPHTPNIPGAERAVYDPLSHSTTLYTFGSGAVERQQAKGDGLLRKKNEGTLARDAPWHGRRKGVVEFVDRTHCFAVNSNDAFLSSCMNNPRTYAARTGELTNWFDNAFQSKMKVPFYGKTPHEMNR